MDMAMGVMKMVDVQIDQLKEQIIRAERMDINWMVTQMEMLNIIIKHPI